VIVIMVMMLVIVVKCDGINYGFDEEIDFGLGWGGGGVCSAGRVVKKEKGGL
jgi:hypothetical protein